MSRFFAAGSDSDSDDDYSDDKITDSESDLSSDVDSDDSDESDDNQQQKSKSLGFNRFLKGAKQDDDDDDDDLSDDGEKGRSTSKKDKRFEEMRSIINTLANAKKISDWVAIQNEFERLNKAYDKSKHIFTYEGINPRFYFRALAELEDFLKNTSANKDATKKMSPSSAKALSTMKQKIKKHNKTFEKEIEAWRQNPVTVEESEEEAENAAIQKEEAAEAAAVAKKKSKKQVESDEEEAENEDDGFTVIGAGGKVVEINQENLFKKLAELLEMRGKKSTDKSVHVSSMQQVLKAASTPFQRVRVLLALIPAQFDVISTTTTGFLPIEVWKSTVVEVNQLFEICEKHTNIVIRECREEEVEPQVLDQRINDGEEVSLLGNLSTFVDRLDDEFTKSLQNIDPHTTEYVDRLKDESALYALIVRCQRYLERIGDEAYVPNMVLRRVEHLYYKPDHVIETIESATATLHEEASFPAETIPPSSLVETLCTSLYKTSIKPVRIRSLLCHVYHHALHDRFPQARDMMLMSHLQETIYNADVQTQILFNRTMVQIGLCAFRCGLIRECANALQDISSTGKVKELLAQGVQSQRHSEKTPEQEKLEKQRQLPFHMHINLELLECVYLTCSMLLEVPNMAMHPHDSRRKTISKPFRRMLDYNERQVFVGPPENTRDHIMAAAKALSGGEWQRCRDLIHAIKIWDLMPGAEKIKEMLAKKIQEEGLRTYLFTYAPYYDSLGLEQLSSMFDLPVGAVHSIVSKMIINEELHASFDQPTNTIVLHRSSQGVEMSRLEYLAGVYSEKIGTFVEYNEKLLESRSVSLGLQDQVSGGNEKGGNANQSRGGQGQRFDNRGNQRQGRQGYQAGGRSNNPRKGGAGGQGHRKNY
ncbi:eukaryotic translation initiation factor 3 subunit 8 N-terminus-domain-containing protein [Polychytrium aggregatum]|uniref:eukaryotic translation initiation factor 3 subunit 8 N-terminus-domain-containing protein n=1 Tax=Polychytrium aggregatum TaxID=110093 RepID=UPI0022FEF5E7|nr:eukaryotic translation initiation factor 3 subunit 8 N-terminus-domain-containing protein [Polychytrium aggregatum]KAI9209580.1 eukaryotic translation initiation factor 3 subunit 8 N-terminus-domain-containing protein [Polychytrium aggregatum]